MYCALCFILYTPLVPVTRNFSSLLRWVITCSLQVAPALPTRKIPSFFWIGGCGICTDIVHSLWVLNPLATPYVLSLTRWFCSHSCGWDSTWNLSVAEAFERDRNMSECRNVSYESAGLREGESGSQVRPETRLLRDFSFILLTELHRIVQCTCCKSVLQ